jgi:hypothetical protein
MRKKGEQQMQKTPLLIDFDLARLSARMLNMFLRGTSEGDRLKNQIVRQLHDELVAERIWRNQGHAGARTFRIDVDFEDTEGIADAIRNLAVDAINLRRAAEQVPTGTPERVDLDAGGEWLLSVCEALQGLRASATAS